MSQRDFRQRARELELACLRGPRIAGGFAGVLAELERARLGEAQRARLRAWVEELQGSAHDGIEQAKLAETDLADA